MSNDPNIETNTTNTTNMSSITYLAVDELDVVGALGVTVARSVLGAGLVAGEAGHATILVHLGEVKGTVDTARHVGNIDIKGELLVEQVEHVVVGLVSHQVDTRANVLAERALSHELELKLATRSSDSVGPGVVGAVESAVGGTSLAIGAKRGVPGAASVAVVVTVLHVKPAPVGVEGDLCLKGSARASSSALLDGKRRVDFGRNVTD